MEHLASVQMSWLQRYRLHQAARRLSSSQRPAERFAYMSSAPDDEDLADGEAGAVDIEGDNPRDNLEHEDALERMECAQHPMSGDSLQEVLFREEEWLACLAGRKTKKLKTSLQQLRKFVNSLGGVPKVRNDLDIKTSGVAESVKQDWSHGEAARVLTLQKDYLEYLVGGRFVCLSYCFVLISLLFVVLVWRQFKRVVAYLFPTEQDRRRWTKAWKLFSAMWLSRKQRQPIHSWRL